MHDKYWLQINKNEAERTMADLFDTDTINPFIQGKEGAADNMLFSKKPYKSSREWRNNNTNNKVEYCAAILRQMW